LAQIVLDVLPCQASSVPCEQLFSGSKQVATDRRARLGSEKFEELQIMKSAWRDKIADLASWNSNQAEEISLEDFIEYLNIENAAHDGLAQWDVLE
jgi:hAT family C-terminal dimerisation region